MIEINDINDPKIAHYRSLRYTPGVHTAEGVFVAEGVKVTEKLLKSDIPVVSVFALPEYFELYHELIISKNIPEDKMFSAGRQMMESIVGFRIHSGIMAMGKKPPARNLDELSNRIIIMNNIIDSENVGSIVRNSAAFGFDSLISDPGSSDPYLRRSVRVSMGHVFGMKVNYSNDLAETLDNLKQTGYSIIAAEITDGSISIDDFHFPGRYAIIFGSEGHGVERHILDLCDHIVHIPMSGDVPSINVAASTAVFLYKAAGYKY